MFHLQKVSSYLLKKVKRMARRNPRKKKLAKEITQSAYLVDSIQKRKIRRMLLGTFLGSGFEHLMNRVYEKKTYNSDFNYSILLKVKHSFLLTMHTSHSKYPQKISTGSSIAF